MKLEEFANAWTRYYTAGKSNYMVAAMEDSGTLQALKFLNRAGRVDFRRVLVLRTVSNYDREPMGTGVAESFTGDGFWQLFSLHALPAGSADHR